VREGSHKNAKPEWMPRAQVGTGHVEHQEQQPAQDGEGQRLAGRRAPVPALLGDGGPHCIGKA
jgi:hypothetical protein